MKTLALLLSLAVPSGAQVVARSRRASAAQAELEKPEFSCPCDRYDYKALTPKGEAAKAYWEARGKAKMARGISTVVLLFGAAFQSGGAVNSAQETYSNAMSELYSARAAAEAAKAVKIAGDDLAETSIEFLIKPGVDYAPPAR